MATVMKNTLSLLAASALLVAVAGCKQSNSAEENPPLDTNTPAPNAEENTSNAWQNTKGAATNAWNATENGATNVWNKTTNAVMGGDTNQ